MTQFDKFMRAFAEKAATDGDKRLLSMFEANRETIRSHFENCLPQNCPWAEYKGPAMHFFGPTFHKGFRQLDILPTGGENAEVWGLLYGNGAPAFWESAGATFGEVNHE